MRVVFAGTPEFSVPSLRALINTPFIDVAGVYTQPDRPAGRGKKLHQSPVKTLAGKMAIPVFQPESFRQPGAIQDLAALHADLMVVTAYGGLLPQAVLEMLPLGCVNIHASLLPRWRGAAPVQRAIEAGDETTGITLMQMQLALDSGPILAQSQIHISESETGGTLQHKLSRLGGEVLKQNLAGISERALKPISQDLNRVTYAAKIGKAESKLNWRQSAQALHRKVRAFNPWPVAVTTLGSTTLRVLQASYRGEAGAARAGEVLHADKGGILVQTARGTLNLEVLQKPGGRPLAAADFLHGMPIACGMIFHSG